MSKINSNEYKPYGKTKAILDRAMEHIKSVDYKVSIRWVFYRLLQESYYKSKSDYTKFIILTSRARHEYYNSWHPTILADETRSIIEHEGWGKSPDIDIDDLIDEAERETQNRWNDLQEELENFECDFYYSIDPNFYQHKYCIIMFEARAMSQQFQKYTNGLSLCPFGG